MTNEDAIHEHDTPTNIWETPEDHIVLREKDVKESSSEVPTRIIGMREKFGRKVQSVVNWLTDPKGWKKFMAEMQTGLPGEEAVQYLEGKEIHVGMQPGTGMPMQILREQNSISQKEAVRHAYELQKKLMQLQAAHASIHVMEEEALKWPNITIIEENGDLEDNPTRKPVFESMQRQTDGTPDFKIFLPNNDESIELQLFVPQQDKAA